MSAPQEMVRDWALAEVGYVPSTGKYNKYAEYLDRTDLYNGLRTDTTTVTCSRTAVMSDT